MNEHLLKRNLERFRKLNIDKWHKVTGQGIKIGIIGFSAGAHHNGAWLVQQIAPGAQIIEYNVMDRDSYRYSWEEAFQKMLNDDIDIVCCSLRKRTWDDNLEELSERLYQNGVVMIDSADNEGEEIDAYPAKSQYWFVVGEYDERDEDRKGYSSYGDKLDFLMYSSFANRTESGSYIPISHTSGAVQVPCGMVALLKEYFGKENFGPIEFKRFLKQNCIDLQEEGKDDNTGYGLFIMPEELTRKEVITLNNPDKIIIHHSLTKDGEVKDFDAIKKYHTETLGWIDIGYHYLIEKVGDKYEILRGRDERNSGAHTKGENTTSIGICLVGNFDIAPPPKEQLEQLYILIEDIFARHGKLPIYTHNHFASYKTCPGTQFPIEEVLTVAYNQNNLSDIKGHWAEEDIKLVVEKGIMKGYPDGTFQPDKPLTRAEYAHMRAEQIRKEQE